MMSSNELAKALFECARANIERDQTDIPMREKLPTIVGGYSAYLCLLTPSFNGFVFIDLGKQNKVSVEHYNGFYNWMSAGRPDASDLIKLRLIL